jgi:hypothetical protein
VRIKVGVRQADGVNDTPLFAVVVEVHSLAAFRLGCKPVADFKHFLISECVPSAALTLTAVPNQYDATSNISW